VNAYPPKTDSVQSETRAEPETLQEQEEAGGDSVWPDPLRILLGRLSFAAMEDVLATLSVRRTGVWVGVDGTTCEVSFVA
jgi:hypothetical protein